MSLLQRIQQCQEDRYLVVNAFNKAWRDCRGKVALPEIVRKVDGIEKSRCLSTLSDSVQVTQGSELSSRQVKYVADANTLQEYVADLAHNQAWLELDALLNICIDLDQATGETSFQKDFSQYLSSVEIGNAYAHLSALEESKDWNSMWALLQVYTVLYKNDNWALRFYARIRCSLVEKIEILQKEKPEAVPAGVLLDDDLQEQFRELVSNNCIDLVKLFLEAGINVNYRDRFGWTPLEVACSKGHFELVKILCAAGANIHDWKKDRSVPLSTAAAFGHLEIAKFLLNSGAYVNAQDSSLRTPLYFSSSNGHLHVVEFLLEAGADANISSDSGATALHGAAQFGDARMVALLLSHGARVDVVDSKGRKPLDLAVNRVDEGMADLLRNAEASTSEVL